MKRSKYSEEQVVRILGEVEAGKTVREVCRAHGLSEFTFYTWRKKYAACRLRMWARCANWSERTPSSSGC